MKIVISIFTVLYMLVTSLFNSYVPVAEDLRPAEDAESSITLTLTQKALLTTVF